MQVLHRRPLDPKASCITCHSGHGGTDQRLLLAGAASTQPTTMRAALVSPVSPPALESQVPR
jgi:hypothetical protein